MRKSKCKACSGRAAALREEKDACITFEKGERIGWESSILPKSSREKDLGHKEIKKGEPAEDTKQALKAQAP